MNNILTKINTFLTNVNDMHDISKLHDIEIRAMLKELLLEIKKLNDNLKK